MTSTPAKYPGVFSGIQPTGIPHLGNYLGALREWKDIQDAALTNPNHDSSRLLFSIVDLHALTGNQSSSLLARHRRESFISLLAIGLSPKYSTLFLQSEVQEHASLMWILSTVASTGYLSRMTQWKSKLSLPDSATMTDSTAIEKLRLGLFSYPVLQAADILLYKPDVIPVGDDQAQHIEFARNLARSFNAAYCPEDKPLFNQPLAQISPAKRVMSLRKPAQKMSKSDADPKSRILVTDSEEEIRAKLKGAVTDSEDGIAYDPEQRVGVANLIDILRHVTRDGRPPEAIARDISGLSKSAFKTMVADAVVRELEPVRERFAELMQPGNAEVKEAYESGLDTARRKAKKTMTEVRSAVGMVGWL